MRFQASQTLSTCFFGFRLTSAGTIERFSIHKMGENAPSTHFLAYTFFSGVRWKQLSKEMGWRGLDTKQGEHEKDFPFCYSGPETKATNTKKKQRKVGDWGRRKSCRVCSGSLSRRRPQSRQKLCCCCCPLDDTKAENQAWNAKLFVIFLFLKFPL